MRFQRFALLDVDPLLKVGECQEILGKVFRPAPSRPTIVAWLEEGTLEGKQIGRGHNWFVFESSLKNFIEGCQQKIAA